MEFIYNKLFSISSFLREAFLKYKYEKGNFNLRMDLLEQLDILNYELGEFDVLIDVGANEGMFARALHDTQSIQHMILVEPNEKLHPFIKVNNPNVSLQICNDLLSNSIKTATFYLSSDTQLSSLFDFEEKQMEQEFSAKNTKNIIQRQTNTLDNLLTNIHLDLKQNKTLLKIDTQGNELDVLKGAVNTLPFIKYCYFEYMFDSPYKKQYSIMDIFDFLRQMNFVMKCPTIINRRKSGKVGAVNFLFERIV